MKTYAVKYEPTNYTKRIYIVAAEDEMHAVIICQTQKTGRRLDGTMDVPSISYFNVKVIEGVNSRKAGIKQEIYHLFDF